MKPVLKPVLGPVRAASVGAVCVLALAGCGTDPQTAGPSIGSSATPAPSVATPGAASGGVSVVPALDPAHAVTAPGPRKQSLVSADLLVQSPTTLSAATVQQIAALPGVRHVEQLSLAQVSVEERVLTIAAVDPTSYRRYTQMQSADLQAMWDRVAGGEVAVAPEWKSKLPTDKGGYVKLGSSATAPEVHVGAYAPQIPLIDAVVNDKWGQSLGVVPGNALIVSTGISAPDEVRKPIQRITGAKTAVQRIDTAGRIGVDPSTVQTAVLVGTVADAVGVYNYRIVGGGQVVPDPGWVASHITTEAVPILGNVTCNRALFPQLRAALQEVVDRGLADKIIPGQYGGCYNPRFIAGTTTLSNHAFGLALDLNVPGNQRGTVGQIDRGVVAAFERFGFTWGGTWHYTDPMHFEMNALVDPR